MAIIKKSNIDNSIFKELKEKYPLVEAENGVSYKQKLEYLTFETDFLKDPLLKALIKDYGFGVIAVIFFLRTEMCENGWKVRIDGLYYNSLIEDCSYGCKLDLRLTQKILDSLIDTGLMYKVQDEQVEKGIWLTCTQQIYNYEMACQKRQTSRNRQAKRRERERAQANQVAEIAEFPELNYNPFGDDTQMGNELF